MNRLTTLKQIGTSLCLALFLLATASIGVASLGMVNDGCTNRLHAITTRQPQKMMAHASTSRALGA
jgi:hypothetical protein